MAAYCPYCMSPTSPGQRCPNCGADPAGYHPSSHHFPMGQLLHKRYLVGRVLGEGGFGITYLGLDTTLERRVAIKEYFPNVFVYRETSVSLDVTCYEGEKRTLYEKGRDQFLQEARVMARFDKAPEIVQVLDFFPANNTAYIVMELLEGDTLRTVLARQGRIPQKYLFEIMEPVLRTMNAMHGAGIIHRDISPDNIMLLKSGQVKLLDFGCARDVDREHTMTVMLKHGYAPMEQYTGYNQGPWTDIYALCATLYHCLTGQPPPRALDRMAGKDPLVPPNRLGAALTPERERALLRGLAVEPRDRWQSTAGLYAALYGTVIKDFPWLPGMQETEILSETETESVQVEAKPESERGTIPLFLDLESESEPQEEWKWEQKKIPEPKPKPESETKPEPRPEPEPEEENYPHPSMRNKTLWACIAAGILVVLILGFWRANHAKSSEPSSDNYDYPKKSIQEMLPLEELDRRSQEGVITMIINPEPEFETGEAVGNLLIENAETNSHPIVVEITRAGTGELIYTSGVIPVGARVDEGTLDAALPAGEYACMATFSYVDEATGESLGSAELGLTVRVLG